MKLSNKTSRLLFKELDREFYRVECMDYVFSKSTNKKYALWTPKDVALAEAYREAKDRIKLRFLKPDLQDTVKVKN